MKRARWLISIGISLVVSLPALIAICAASSQWRNDHVNNLVVDGTLNVGGGSIVAGITALTGNVTADGPGTATATLAALTGDVRTSGGLVTAIAADAKKAA